MSPSIREDCRPEKWDQKGYKVHGGQCWFCRNGGKKRTFRKVRPFWHIFPPEESSWCPTRGPTRTRHSDGHVKSFKQKSLRFSIFQFKAEIPTYLLTNLVIVNLKIWSVIAELLNFFIFSMYTPKIRCASRARELFQSLQIIYKTKVLSDLFYNGIRLTKLSFPHAEPEFIWEVPLKYSKIINSEYSVLLKIQNG
jgi:hypothetical protein